MALIIRKYAQSDLGAVLSAWEQASLIAHPFLTDEFMAFEKEQIANVYMPNAETWVAEVNDQVVGFISLAGNEVGGLFLHPDFHGKGIGRVLMDQAQTIHGELEVEVFEENTIGRKFYDRYGFKFMEKKTNEATGNSALRLKFIPT